MRHVNHLAGRSSCPITVAVRCSSALLVTAHALSSVFGLVECDNHRLDLKMS